MSTDNPFRNAIETLGRLPDALKPAFHTAFVDDWADLTSNANPLEHKPAGDTYEAVLYILEWAGFMCDTKADHPSLLSEPELSNRYKVSADDTREWLRRLADAYDLIPFDTEPIESTFAGEHISTGHFLDLPSRDDFPLTDSFAIIVEDDDDNPVTYHFQVTDHRVRIMNV